MQEGFTSKKSNWTLGENKAKQSQFYTSTAETAEDAERKGMCVSNCATKKYALYPVTPRSLRAQRLMKSKANLHFLPRRTLRSQNESCARVFCLLSAVFCLFSVR